MSLIGTGNPVGRPAGLKERGDSKEDSDILQEMRKRFEHACQREDENRQNYIKCTKISSSNDQWDAEVKKRRGANRPALTFNLLNLIVKQIIGEYRQNKMEGRVSPSGGAATEDIAEIISGIIRHVKKDSNADLAYVNALECSCRGNIGYFRLVPEYESDDVFNQKLVIKSVQNPLTVLFDPNAKLLSRSDAEFAYVTEKIARDEFKRLYPEADEQGWDIIDIDEEGTWGDDKEIRVCEYFTKERKMRRLVAFDNKMVVQIDSDEEIAALEQIGVKPVKERQAERVNIRWRKCNASHVLDERVYKTKYIPIVPVIGEEVNIEGKTLLRGAIYYAIDAQHSYNYERSTAIENSSLSARAPWKVTLKMIEMFRALWDEDAPQKYLLYTPDPAVPQGPERIEPPTPSTAAMQNAQLAATDVQRTTGVFNAQVGEQSNIVSGVGLQEQQSQGNTSTFIFTDNLRAAIEHGDRILIDWLPEFIDTEQTVRIINAEGDIDMETVNQKQENPLLGITTVLNDITVGDYDVTCVVSKAPASRQKETVEGLMNWAKSFPEQAPLVADIALESLDIQKGKVAADRVKRSLPPQIVLDPDSPEGQQAAQQAAQKQQQAQQLQQQVIQGKLAVEEGKNQAGMAKAGAEVQKAQAEVVKAKADVAIAIEETHQHKIEHVMAILDSIRQANEPSPNSGGNSQANS